MSSPPSELEQNGAGTPNGYLSEKDDGGLFGSGSEPEDSEYVHLSITSRSSTNASWNSIQRRSPKRRKLGDSEIDSGDDEGRQDRVHHEEEADEDDEIAEKTAIIADVSIAKHPGPLPSDDEVHGTESGRNSSD